MDELTREIFLVLCSDDYRYLFIDNSEGGRYDLAISVVKVVDGLTYGARMTERGAISSQQEMTWTRP